MQDVLEEVSKKNINLTIGYRSKVKYEKNQQTETNFARKFAPPEVIIS